MALFLKKDADMYASSYTRELEKVKLQKKVEIQCWIHDFFFLILKQEPDFFEYNSFCAFDFGVLKFVFISTERK